MSATRHRWYTRRVEIDKSGYDAIGNNTPLYLVYRDDGAYDFHIRGTVPMTIAELIETLSEIADQSRVVWLKHPDDGRGYYLVADVAWRTTTVVNGVVVLEFTPWP